MKDRIKDTSKRSFTMNRMILLTGIALLVFVMFALNVLVIVLIIVPLTRAAGAR